MSTQSQAKLAGLLAAAVVVVGLVATVADAQQVIWDVGVPVVPAGAMHYHRFYAGSSLQWTPQWGWHTHARYIDVPCWGSPSVITYPPIYVSSPPLCSSGWGLTVVRH